jgi:hypothetical protein
MSTRFGLLAYGPSAALHREAAVALLTLQAHAPAQREIILLTDHPALYRWFGNSITIERLTPATIVEWRGPSGDRLRPKLEALRRLAADRTADVALIDTDTMARHDLSPMTDRLAAGALMMHRREYSLASPPRKGDRSLTKEILGRSWQGIVPDPVTAAMWNGGVVASSRGHQGIFDCTLAVFDQMRAASRHFAIDQLACSIVFAAHGRIEEAAPWFDHYWANRPWFRVANARFLSRALLEGQTPIDARELLRRQPIVGPLDGRAPWWLTRLRRLLAQTEPDDDDVPESAAI